MEEGRQTEPDGDPELVRPRHFDITPSHPTWTHLERGIQIVLGVALVTVITFLGESWGEPDVPYRKIFPPLGNVGFAFIGSLLITPLAGYVGMLLRATTRLPNYRINQIRAVGFNLILLVLVAVLYLSARDFLFALMEARGLDPYNAADWE